MALAACRTPAPVVAMPVPVEIVEADVVWHREARALADARAPDPGPPTASPLPPFVGVDRGTAVYVGTASCARCHGEAATALSLTAHAHALATLEDANASRDPRCLRCHVVGWGRDGGFPGRAAPGAPEDAPTPEALANVGCEACHGPGSAHVAAPAAGYGDLPADGSACVACHTIETSPDFRWDARWPLVAH